MERVETVTGYIPIYSFDEWMERNPWTEELDELAPCEMCYGDGEHECPDCSGMHSCGECDGTGERIVPDERSYNIQRKKDLKNWGEWHTQSKVSKCV